MSRKSHWQRGLRSGSAAAFSLGFRVWIPAGAWMSVFCECCVFWSRSLRRTDHSSGGAQPNVVCLSMIVKPQQWGSLGPLGALGPWGGRGWLSHRTSVSRWLQECYVVSSFIPLVRKFEIYIRNVTVKMFTVCMAHDNEIKRPYISPVSLISVCEVCEIFFSTSAVCHQEDERHC
jgi:hypothetical protein